VTTPTATLVDEHRVILAALDTLERAAERLRSGASLPEGAWSGLVAWLRAFADRSHHAKEENALFPAMVKAGAPSEGGPIGTMLEEHAQARALIRAMDEGPPASRAACAREYAALLRAHIAKENDVLFPLAEASLDPAAARELCRALEAAEAELGSDASVAHAEQTLARLAAALA
jgi:hemerythrin-like domain-containing protein